MTVRKTRWYALYSISFWLIILISYILPFGIEMWASDSEMMELQSSVVWFICLIPAILFTYHFGIKGGIVTTLFNVLFRMITELLDDGVGYISELSLHLMAEVTFAGILLIIPVHILVKKLRLESAQLEVVSEELHKSKEQLQNIFDNIDVAIWSLDVKNHSLQVSAELERLYGISKQEITAHPTTFWKEMIHPEDRAGAEELDQQLQQGKPTRGTYRIVRPNGDIRWVLDRGVPLVDEDGNVIRIDGTIMDITEEKQRHNVMKRLAYYDPLTQLPNRRLFEEYLNEVIQTAEKNGEQLAVLFIDLDGFKAVNDTWGHHAGDMLLQEVASRFQRSIRETDMVARLAGDEFMAVLPAATSYDASQVAERIIEALQAPVVILGNELMVTPSVGIAPYPQHGTTSERLIKQADTAMYQAKKREKNTYYVLK